ncbi:MAG TPA: zf-TFIIB domain-containing protein [Candidatus Polarisedimenticolia bacterium]|nr:zf-TFIIB domain-containing protein [Candidatus Polarisedimenticolia bacterium]
MADPITMNCPTCGAPVSSDATQCEHCGSRLAVVACPSCFGMVFAGAKFCSHCGAAIARKEVQAQTNYLCPRCRVNMEAVLIGKTHLEECPKCQGIWADTDSLQQIYSDREQQSAVLGTAGPLPEGQGYETDFRYIPCPVCNKLMNRVNFAHCSHVIVDVCREHGTWFDKDELRRIVEFIRAGGLQQARADEIYELERKREELRAAQIPGAGAMPMSSGSSNYYGDVGMGLASAAGHLIDGLFFK